jgi:hypothetical protein
MNKLLSDTRLVAALVALAIICLTVLAALKVIPGADALKLLSGLVTGVIITWQRGTVAPTVVEKTTTTIEEKKEKPASPIPPILPLLMWTVVYFSGFLVIGSCASAKPYIRTADDAASWACAAFYGKKQGLSLDDAAKTFCKSKAQLQPWLDQLLALERQGVTAEKCESADAGKGD